MRVELADDVADGARRLLGLRTRRQAELAHRIDDAPLNGLEPVSDLRQRPIENHVHRVVQVRLLGVLLERLLFDAFEIQAVLHSFYTSARLSIALRPAQQITLLPGLSVLCPQHRNSHFCQISLVFEPFAAILRTLLGQQHVHHLVRLVARIDGELHEAPRIAVHRRLAQL